jgi:hypothetical protein
MIKNPQMAQMSADGKPSDLSVSIYVHLWIKKPQVDADLIPALLPAGNRHIMGKT